MENVERYDRDQGNKCNGGKDDGYQSPLARKAERADRHGWTSLPIVNTH
jgi:hypothetical protein